MTKHYALVKVYLDKLYRQNLITYAEHEQLDSEMRRIYDKPNQMCS